MPEEKIKVKLSELTDMYDIEDDHDKHYDTIIEDVNKKIKSNAEVDFEAHSENVDKEDDKRWRIELEDV